MPGFSDSIEAFQDAARAARGLDDFGADDYREALGVLCRSLDTEARLTPVGREAVRGLIVDALIARLVLEAGWRRHPEAGEVPIEAPIVIVGLPRSGTTALHHLMSRSPGVQSLEHWLMRTPRPRPPRARWGEDPDFREAADRLESVYARSPAMRAIHEIEADLPDECWNLFAQCFAHSGWPANVDVPGYAAWWLECDMEPAYRRHRRAVQLIGLGAPPGGPGTTPPRWLFKDSTHLFALDALLATYPDARIVQTHRDPAQVLPSVCSLCWSSRAPLNETDDRKVFGRATLDLWQRGMDDFLRVRKQDEARHPERYLDLPFARFTADPIAAIREIHERFDLPWNGETEQTMRRFRAERPPGRHGGHRYGLEEWDLEADEIEARFAPYLRRFDVAREGAS
ncbi:MAG: sulfotransferase [Myxococcota bacterium]